jgi:hypothetical protein
LKAATDCLAPHSYSNQLLKGLYLMKYFVILAALLSALLSPIQSTAQTQVNPSTQVRWPAITGAVDPVSPAWPCDSSHYGQPYTNTVSGNLFVCATSGWVKASGTTTLPSGPQYSIQTSNISTFGHSTAFTDATGNPLTVLGTLTGNVTNGALNAAQYGGVVNAYASSDCVAGCDVEVPQTSASTEEVTTKTGSQAHDFRLGGANSFFQNPPSRVYNLFGASYASARTVYSLWDQATPSAGNYPGQQQDALHLVNTFNGKGFYFGTWGGPYLGSDWSSVHGINISQTVSTPTIASMISGTQDKFSSGDGQNAYLYNNTDGGCSSGGDECSTGLGLQDNQHSSWFHGTVAAGATTGTQLLPVTYTAGTNSRSQVSVGGIMLNLHSIAVSGANVTGVATQVPGYAAWATPTDATVTVSGAYGLAQAAIPTPITNINPQTDTVTFSVDGGTNAGGYVVGTACLDGAAKYEQVAITAVGTLSGGQQSVTFTHRYPNPQLGTSLWQNAGGGLGGLCGTYYMASQPFFNGPFAGWRTDYPVFGARSIHEIVGRFLTSSSGTMATSAPIPTLWNSSTANVGLVNLSVSGTTVTAGFASTNSSSVLDNLASAVISNASNSAFNGTVTNVKLSNNNQTISWTQSGVSGTSATAQISYPQVYFNYYLFRGAAVVQPATSAGVPLEPNSVDWSVGNLIENPFDPAFGGYTVAAAATVNSPDSGSINNIGAFNFLGGGMGISGQYKFLSEQNTNPSSWYVGGGGWLTAPRGIILNGPMSTAITVAQFPIDGKPAIALGCVVSTQGGCGNARNDMQVMSVDGGAGKINYTSTTQDWYLNNVKTARTRANILSTGDGTYVNGGFTPGLPVALTSAADSRSNLQAALGTYGTFGNEGILDTSAIIADKTHYSGTLYAGAAPPTITSVQPQGTTGSSTWSYVATSVTQNGESLPSAVTLTNTGNATLSSTNKNSIFILLGYGAQSTKVYRTAGPGSPSLGLICTVTNNLISGSISSGACDDTGQAAGAAPPAVDTTGKVMSAQGTFTGSLTVAGQNVCQANGTNCPSAANLPVGALTTTAAASDNVTVTGMTASGHCSLTATNAAAATNIATTYVSAKITNQITVTHTATAGMTYDVLCTPY